MKLVPILITVLFSLACQRKQDPPVPFKMQLVGLAVRFPITVGQLLSEKQAVLKRRNGLPLHFFTRIDSTSVNWFYNWRTYPMTERGQTTPPDSAQLYGVVLLIPNKAANIDSVKKWLEGQLGKPTSALSIEHLNLEHESIYTPRTPVYTWVPSRGTRVSLRVGDPEGGDYGLFIDNVAHKLDARDKSRNLLRIAISHGLTSDEEERFAVGSGPTIWKDAD